MRVRTLQVLVHNPAADIHGRTVFREAVRGIIRKDRNLLMLYSEMIGDYKFPGGGIRDCESHAAALNREVREELGRDITGELLPFGIMVEFDLAAEQEFDVFKMTSYYYWCEVGNAVSAQQLDPYEKDLQFVPAWVGLDAAIQKNRYLVENRPTMIPRWVKRDLEVLEQIREAIDKPAT